MDDDGWRRFFNDDHIRPMMRVKLISIEGEMYPALFAIRDIKAGEECTYNYGALPSIPETGRGLQVLQLKIA